jgi:nucleoside-diphosphate-sugar epimerase
MNLGGSGYITDDYDKILAERAVVNDAALPATVLRLPMIYGPGDQYHRLWPYIKRMKDRRPAILLNEATAAWRSTWGYVDNVAAAIALAAENRHAAGRIYNVSDASQPTMADWVRGLAETTGWRGSLHIVSQPCPPPSFGLEYNAKQDLVCDGSRIRQELGYVEPISRQEALERTVHWDREHPPAQTDPKQFDYAAEDEISRVHLETRKGPAHRI